MSNILALLDEIRAIALTGLNFDQDYYNRERYERLLRLAAGQYATLSEVPENEITVRWREELGYITPKMGCCAAIFDEAGRMLLVKRSDNGKWGLPGGYAEVNQTPEQNLRREVWEETGLEVEVGDLVDVFCVLPGQYGQPNTNYILMYHCAVTGGVLAPSHETPEVGYFDHTAITDWHFDHGERAKRAYAEWINRREQEAS